MKIKGKMLKKLWKETVAVLKRKKKIELET